MAVGCSDIEASTEGDITAACNKEQMFFLTPYHMFLQTKLIVIKYPK